MMPLDFPPTVPRSAPRIARDVFLIVLAAGLALVMAAAVFGQLRPSSGAGGGAIAGELEVGGTPQWSSAADNVARKYHERGAPEYALYRFEGRYYALSSGRWYMSPRERGQFHPIDERSVPRELFRVARQN